MRLLELSITSFRGFGAKTDTLRLDADMVLFYGPNGFGKTSVAEAIEWLFYGVTRRRQRGDSYSRSEYAGSYSNIHGGAVTNVEALVSLNGRDVRICRKLLPNESSATFVNGRAALFREVGVKAVDAVHPVIAQHGLQAFIHSKPKERRDAVCAALGLDELTDFKSTLESARSSLQRSPPIAVQAARRELAANAALLGTINATATLAVRWQKNPMQLDPIADMKALLKGSESLTGIVPASTQQALEQLRSARQEASRAVFDIASLETPEDGAERLAAMRLKATEISDELKSVVQAIGTVIAAMTTSFAPVLLEFWKTGLSLSTEGDACPMCEAPTLDAAHRAELAHRLSTSELVLTKRKALATEAETAATALDQMQRLVTEFGVEQLEPHMNEKVRQLLADNTAICDAFHKEHEAFLIARSGCEDYLKETRIFIAGCVDQLADPAKAAIVNAAALELLPFRLDHRRRNLLLRDSSGIRSV